MNGLVLDASAVVALLGKRVPDRVPMDAAWVSPSFVDIEFSNVLWKRVAFSGTSREKAEKLWKAYLGLPILRIPDGRLLDSARAFAYDNRCTVYDALYAVLAQQEGFLLATADKKLASICNTAEIDVFPMHRPEM